MAPAYYESVHQPAKLNRIPSLQSCGKVHRIRKMFQTIPICGHRTMSCTSTCETETYNVIMAIPLSLSSKFKHIQFILQCLANIVRLEMGHFMNTLHPARKMSSLCYTPNREEIHGYQNE